MTSYTSGSRPASHLCYRYDGLFDLYLATGQREAVSESIRAEWGAAMDKMLSAMQKALREEK